MTTLAPPYLNGSFFMHHEILDEFESGPDSITDYGVRCPLASEKMMYNVVSTLAPQVFIGFSSFLQVMRTVMKFRMSWKFSQI